MKGISRLLTLTVMAGFAAPAGLYAQAPDLPLPRARAAERDLIATPRLKATDAEVDEALDKLARDALTKVGVKTEPAEAVIDDQLTIVIRQFTPRMRPILDSELRFVRAVCGLSDAQIRQIAPDGERAFQAAVKRCAEVKRGELAGRWGAWGKNIPRPNPRKMIQERLAVAIRGRLSAELLGRYEREIARRDEDRKQAGVLNLVARLDQVLSLSPGQRDELVATLAAHWNEGWFETSAIYGDTYLLNIPDQLVVPSLTRTQKDVWLGASKVEAWLGIAGLIEVEDAEIDGGEAPKADAKKRAPEMK